MATEGDISVRLKPDGTIDILYDMGVVQKWFARHGKEVKIELLQLEAGGAGEFSDPGAYRTGFTYDTQAPEDIEAGACYGGLCHGCGKNVEKRYVRGWWNLCAKCARVSAAPLEEILTLLEPPCVPEGEVLKFPCQTCGMQPLMRERFVNGLGAAIVEHRCAKCGKVQLLDEFVQGGPGRMLHVDGKPVPDAPYHTLPFGAVEQPPPTQQKFNEAMRRLIEKLPPDSPWRPQTLVDEEFVGYLDVACDCGAEKTGTTHADYCSTRKP